MSPPLREDRREEESGLAYLLCTTARGRVRLLVRDSRAGDPAQFGPVQAQIGQFTVVQRAHFAQRAAVKAVALPCSDQARICCVQALCARDVCARNDMCHCSVLSLNLARRVVRRVFLSSKITLCCNCTMGSMINAAMQKMHGPCAEIIGLIGAVCANAVRALQPAPVYAR